MKIPRKFLFIILLLSITPLAFGQSADNSNPSSTANSPVKAENTIPSFSGDGFTLVPADPNTINSRKFIFELKPGQSVQEEVVVKNLSPDKGSNFSLYGADPTFSAQGTPAYKTHDATGQGEGKWVTFEEPTLYLEPLEEKKIKFTLQIPTDAPYGDYRIGIAMEKTQKDSSNNAITIATRVILHSEIKVTDNPQVIPRLSSSTTRITAPITPIQNQPWKSYYFWISLGLFLLSLIILMVITWKERKLKKNAAIIKKTKLKKIAGSLKKVVPLKKKTLSKKRAATKKPSKI